jgi:hypothetical protein
MLMIIGSIKAPSTAVNGDIPNIIEYSNVLQNAAWNDRQY